MENNTEIVFLVIRRDMGVLGLALFRTPATLLQLKKSVVVQLMNRKCQQCGSHSRSCQNFLPSWWSP